MTYFFIIALTLSLITVLRQYIIKNRNYDYALFIPTIIAWVNSYFKDETLLYITFISIPVILLLSLILWDNINIKNIIFKFFNKKQNHNITTQDIDERNKIIDENIQKVKSILKGVQGIVSTKMNNGSYLGCIVKDGTMQDIIVYSNDDMNNGDKFEVLGLEKGKFMAKKI